MHIKATKAIKICNKQKKKSAFWLIYDYIIQEVQYTKQILYIINSFHTVASEVVT
jgi:hypothetical protein